MIWVIGGLALLGFVWLRWRPYETKSARGKNYRRVRTILKKERIAVCTSLIPNLGNGTGILGVTDVYHWNPIDGIEWNKDSIDCKWIYTHELPEDVHEFMIRKYASGKRFLSRKDT